MGKRREERVEVKLPLRIYGTDRDGKPFTRLAQTADISSSGARATGLYIRLAVGAIVGVQHGGIKARFRVSWIGQPGSAHAGQLGLHCLEPHKNVWQRTWPNSYQDTYQSINTLPERRQYERLNCDIGVEVTAGLGLLYTRCTDISAGGCYLETWTPLPTGSRIALTAKIADGTMQATAVVRTTHPGVGMGLQFLTVATPKILESFTTQLRSQQNGAATAAESHVQSMRHLKADQSSVAVPEMSSSPTRVLLADDSRFLRNAYAQYLRREGFEVTTAEDGEQVLNLVTDQLPDVIVLDLLMPKVGGVDTLRLLKADPMTTNIPVVVLSALSHSNEQKLISDGAAAYVEKNLMAPEHLPKLVKRILGSTTFPPAFQAGCARPELGLAF